MYILTSSSISINMTALKNTSLSHKKIPETIRSQAQEALSFYPELKEVPIEFRFKKKIKKSTMQAQPKFSSLCKNKGNCRNLSQTGFSDCIYHCIGYGNTLTGFTGCP